MSAVMANHSSHQNKQTRVVTYCCRIYKKKKRKKGVTQETIDGVVLSHDRVRVSPLTKSKKN